jgi:membrane protease YdiL (CAAX protease family)
LVGDPPSGPAAFAGQAAFFLVFVGPVEELVWRGYILGVLRDVTASRHVVVIVAAALFGMWHYPVEQNLVHVATTAVQGIVYGYARLSVRDMTTAATGLAHSLHDTPLPALAMVAG